MAEEYLDFSQALDALNITETELWELIHSGTLKAYRAGGVIKFKKSDIIAYQKSRGTEPTIVVSRKMLDTMEEGDVDEEGMDTEVGLRAAARRPSEDDLATSEITVKERAIEETDETIKLDSQRARRASTRASAKRPGTASVRSKRISAVLETEKKGNPIMNLIMIVLCLILLYNGAIQVATLQNESWDEKGAVKVAKPAWISAGLLAWGTDFGGGKNSDVAGKMKANGININYEGKPIIDTDALRKKYEQNKKGEENGDEEEPEEGAGENEED